jgi:hypothetical protein
MPAPPNTAFLERMVGRTFLSGAWEQFFNRLLAGRPEIAAVGHPIA